MGTFVCYMPMKIKDIRKSAKETIPQIEEWFVQNPKKDVCVAQLWYGRQVDVKRGNVKEDVTAAMNEAITRTKEMTKPK